MNKTITLLRNGWTALLLISLVCFAITSSGIGPTWATWNLGLYATLALLSISTVASIAYISWTSMRSIFSSSDNKVVQMPTQAKPLSTQQAGMRKAA